MRSWPHRTPGQNWRLTNGPRRYIQPWGTTTLTARMEEFLGGYGPGVLFALINRDATDPPPGIRRPLRSASLLVPGGVRFTSWVMRGRVQQRPDDRVPGTY